MQSQFETPILFLIFNRPDTTRVVFEQIKKASPKFLFIASDGPRESVPGEKETCQQTRQIINEIDWQCEVKTLFRDQNLGCGLAVSSALGWFFEQVSEGIILEDDCLPDLSFFTYCQELLLKYRDTPQVKLIGGNNFQGGRKRGSGSYYFSRYPEIWGWASWRRVWKEYQFEINGLDEAFTPGNTKFDFSSAQEKKYWYGNFLRTQQGKTNTWDYQLMYSILNNNGIAISPQINLVKNIGLDNKATHLSLLDSRKNVASRQLKFPLVHPPIVVDKNADQFTYSQIYARSPRRLARLIKENGISNILRYMLNKVLRR